VENKRQALKIILLIALVFFLFGNSGFRKMIRRYWEMHRLKTRLTELVKENTVLKKEIYDLETNSSYIERMARKELGLISSDEVEYRFNGNK
jgi:cell division protein FtsB